MALPSSRRAGEPGYSHVWLIFVFHENTNWGRAAATAAVNAKVTPPRLGEPVGLFGTRTPHRPCPLGLSLVRLERVEAGTPGQPARCHGTAYTLLNPRRTGQGMRRLQRTRRAASARR